MCKYTHLTVVNLQKKNTPKKTPVSKFTWLGYLHDCTHIQVFKHRGTFSDDLYILITNTDRDCFTTRFLYKSDAPICRANYCVHVL